MAIYPTYRAILDSAAVQATYLTCKLGSKGALVFRSVFMIYGRGTGLHSGIALNIQQAQADGRLATIAVLSAKFIPRYGTIAGL